MDFIDFNLEARVGIRSIDDQHDQIADVINNIYEGILAANKGLILMNMRKLTELLEIHFETEERLMKETHFDGYFSHKLEHDRFYQQILTSTDRFSKDMEIIGIKQLKGIKRWFFNHIELNDRRCGKYLADNGIS